MTRRLQTGRSGKAALGAIGMVACAPILSGCFYLSPSQTTASYDGGPGAHATVGDLEFANVHIIATAKDSAGTMEGQVTNTSAAAIQLTVVVGGQASRVSIPADTALRLDGKPSGNSDKTIKPVVVAKTPVQPGKSADVTISVPGTGQTPILVPVLTPQQAYVG
ncbi:MAG: hypothetical protein ABI360_01430 [Allobranchiibius sp.]